MEKYHGDIPWSKNTMDIPWSRDIPLSKKCEYENLSTEYHGEKPTTLGGNLKAPEIETYLQWVYDAWESMSKESIIKSFHSCGITNSIDGSQDELISCFKVYFYFELAQ